MTRVPRDQGRTPGPPSPLPETPVNPTPALRSPHSSPGITSGRGGTPDVASPVHPGDTDRRDAPARPGCSVAVWSAPATPPRV